MEIVVIFFLILLNGFFALSEIALVSSKKVKLEEFATRGVAQAGNVLRLLENPETFLSSVQIGITLIGIVSGAVGGIALSDDLAPFFYHFGLTREYSAELAVATVVAVITYLSIVIGELLPKTVAINNPEKIALIVAPAIRLFILITYPFVKLLSLSTQFLQRIFFIKTGGGEVMTEEELRVMLRMAHKQGVLEQYEAEMHQNVFSFVDKKAYQVMTHRSDIDYIWLQDSLEDMQKSLKESSHSVFPVCGKSVDDVIGIITVKDFLENYRKQGFTLESIIKTPLFIPEALLATRILNRFRRLKQYFGVVIDEYGAFKGIITLHDLAECILGDLPDLNEPGEPDITVREDLSLLVNGQTPIEELCDVLHTKVFIEKEHRYRTVAGLVIAHIGRIPQTGEKIVIDTYSFEIVDMDINRIDKILVSKVELKEAEHQG